MMPCLSHARFVYKILTGAFACLFASGAAAQSTDTVYSLHGTVINGLTSEPIARALVQSGDRRLATMSDSEGHFVIDIHVPAAPASGGNRFDQFARLNGRFSQQLYLTATRPGYLAPEQLTAFPLDETLGSTDVKLKLMPGAIVTGRVSATGTDSAANVRLMLLIHGTDGEGNRTWTQAGFHQTNADGTFRFTNLRPGEYTLLTGEWNGERQAGPRGRNTVTQHYPPVYAGDTSSMSTATKLRLHYGGTAQTDLHLHLAMFYPVTIPLANASSVQFASARITDADPFSTSSLGYNRELGAVEGSLPSGHYNLLLNGGGPQQQGFAMLPITVADAPLRTAAIALSPAGTIAVHVHTQFTATQNTESRVNVSSHSGALNSRQNGGQTQQQAPLQLQLRPESQRAGVGGAFTQPGATPDELVLNNVQPGTYLVRPQMFRGYAASITSDGVDLLQHPLVVNAGSSYPPIDVVVRDDTATLTGTVTRGDGPLPQQCIVLLIPADGPARPTYIGPEGKFTAPNLPPGTYSALALPATQMNLAYHDPETMRRFDGKDVTVDLSPGQQGHADIPLLNAADAEEQ